MSRRKKQAKLTGKPSITNLSGMRDQQITHLAYLIHHGVQELKAFHCLQLCLCMRKAQSRQLLYASVGWDHRAHPTCPFSLCAQRLPGCVAKRFTPRRTVPLVCSRFIMVWLSLWSMRIPVRRAARGGRVHVLRLQAGPELEQCPHVVGMRCLHIQSGILLPRCLPVPGLGRRWRCTWRGQRGERCRQ